MPVNVLSESIGSGPACSLARGANPPDRLVLVVPFDRLAAVAAEKFPFLPVGLLLRDRWDNVAALSHYSGPVTIYGAAEDRIIPVTHARHLAQNHPGSKFVLLPGGHNDWAAQAGLLW